MSREELVEVWRAAAAVDEYGDPVPGVFSKVGEFQGLFAPANPTKEVVVGADPSVEKAAVYVTELVDVTDRDRLRVRGVDYAVDGVPRVWARPDGYGMHIQLLDVEG